MESPPLPPAVSRPTTEEERRARLFEAEVFPLVGQRLANLLIGRGAPLAGCRVLGIGCGLGSPLPELLQKMDASSQLVVLEDSAVLVERARAALGDRPSAKRLSFRAHQWGQRLPFADGAFDLVLGSVPVSDLPRPEEVVADLARVTRAGGQVRLATLLRGTWGEFLDVYRDVLVRLQRDDALASLRGYAGSFPAVDAVVSLMEAAGLGSVTVERDSWDLVFRSAREFFYAPVIEMGPLPRWRRIAGKGPQVQDTLLAVKQAIDTYFAGQAFAVGVTAGLFCGKKPA